MRNATKPDSLQRALYKLLDDRAWWSLAELANELQRWGYRALDTTISARLRDLRKPPYNRMLWTRAREGTHPTVYEYSIQCADDAPPHHEKTELEVMRLHADKGVRRG